MCLSTCSPQSKLVKKKTKKHLFDEHLELASIVQASEPSGETPDIVTRIEDMSGTLCERESYVVLISMLS